MKKNSGLVEFGKTVKKNRERYCFSLRTMANLIGISHSTLSRIERGKKMDVISFALTCRYLGIPTHEWLLAFLR